MKPIVVSDTMRERLEGYCERSPRRGPETVHIDVTNACNLNCITCWNYAPDLRTPKSVAWKRMRIDEAHFSRVLAGAIDTGVERILLSGGGEPFAHPSMYEFIAQVKSRGLRLTIITNGTLVDFERLRALAPDQILLNCASASPETYVAYHPNQPHETFARILEGAARLRGVTAVNLVQVIQKTNWFEIPEMIGVAARVGARCSFKVGDLPAGTEAYGLGASERREVLEVLIPRARERARALGVRHNLDAYEAQLRGEHESSSACFAGYLYSRVQVDARVMFCCESIEVGSVREASFPVVWTSERYQRMRERLHAGEGVPGCARCGKHDMNFAAARALEQMMEEAT